MSKILEERKVLGLKIAKLTKSIVNGEKVICPSCNMGVFLQQGQSSTYYCSHCKNKLIIDLIRK